MADKTDAPAITQNSFFISNRNPCNILTLPSLSLQAAIAIICYSGIIRPTTSKILPWM